MSDITNESAECLCAEIDPSDRPCLDCEMAALLRMSDRDAETELRAMGIADLQAFDERGLAFVRRIQADMAGGDPNG